METLIPQQPFPQCPSYLCGGNVDSLTIKRIEGKVPLLKAVPTFGTICTWHFVYNKRGQLFIKLCYRCIPKFSNTLGYMQITMPNWPYGCYFDLSSLKKWQFLETCNSAFAKAKVQLARNVRFTRKLGQLLVIPRCSTVNRAFVTLNKDSRQNEVMAHQCIF